MSVESLNNYPTRFFQRTGLIQTLAGRIQSTNQFISISQAHSQ